MQHYLRHGNIETKPGKHTNTSQNTPRATTIVSQAIQFKWTLQLSAITWQKENHRTRLSYIHTRRIEAEIGTTIYKDSPD